jgi:hypothetical protein
MTAGFTMVWCELDETEIFSPLACNKGVIFKMKKRIHINLKHKHDA